jgi:pyruvate,water dikinase
LWLRTWRLGEWLDAPLSPLFRTFLVPRLVQARESAGSCRFGQRLPRMWRAKSPAHCVVNGWFFARAEPRPASLWLLPLRFLTSELTGGWCSRWQQRSIASFLDRVSEARRTQLEDCSSQAILRQLDGLAADVGECWYAIGLASGGAVPLKRFLARLLRNEVPDLDILVLLRGVGTRAMEAHGTLFAFARSLGRTGGPADVDTAAVVRALVAGERGPFYPSFQAALEAVGHQVSSLDLVAPCLGESAPDLASTVDLYRRPGAVDPLRTVQRARSERALTLAAIRNGLPSRKRWLFDRLYQSLCRHEEILEATSFDVQRAWPEFRRRWLELGKRLQGAGAILRAEDVLLLPYEAVVGALSDGASPATLTETVERNRRARQSQARLEPPCCIPPQGDPAWEKAPVWPVNLRALGGGRREERWSLKGIAASPGRRSGTARLCRSLTDAVGLQEGEILIVSKATPEWTPLFTLAGGFVADNGGVTSHSAVIAREFGIPAVVGTQRATHAIKDGDFVTVDGSAGLVELTAPEIARG